MQAKHRWLANRSQGRRAVGGVLTVEAGELRFAPNAFDAAFGGMAWKAPLAAIAAVGVEPGRFALSELFSGGLRSRLALDLADGKRELFVVGNVEKVCKVLAGLIEGT